MGPSDDLVSSLISTYGGLVNRALTTWTRAANEVRARRYTPAKLTSDLIDLTSYVAMTAIRGWTPNASGLRTVVFDISTDTESGGVYWEERPVSGIQIYEKVRARIERFIFIADEAACVANPEIFRSSEKAILRKPFTGEDVDALLEELQSGAVLQDA